MRNLKLDFGDDKIIKDIKLPTSDIKVLYNVLKQLVDTEESNTTYKQIARKLKKQLKNETQND